MLAIQMAKSDEERRRLEQEELRVQAQEAEAERLELEAAERRRLQRECVDEEERQKIAALVQEEVRYPRLTPITHAPHTSILHVTWQAHISALTCD